MGRPPLALGTADAIRLYKTDTGYRARVLVRDYDGRVRALERRAASKTAAERALKLALRDRAPTQARGEITGDSRVSALAEAWYAGLADLSPITMQAYRDRLDRQILPRLGQLRVRELSVGTLDRHLRGIADQHGVATGRMCRSVLSGMCTLAARHDALAQNPVRALGPVNGRRKKAPRALTVPELRQLRAALSYDDRAMARDLPDLVGFLMATGLRIGEACGLAWNAVDSTSAPWRSEPPPFGCAVRAWSSSRRKPTPGSAPWCCRAGAPPCCATGPNTSAPLAPTAAADQSSPHPWVAGATPPTPRPTSAKPSPPLASTGSPPTPSARPSPRSWTTPAYPPVPQPTNSATPTPP
jgi:hypothetical protein